MFTYFTPFQLMVDVELAKGLPINYPNDLFEGTVLHPLNDITEIIVYCANRQFIGRSQNPPGVCDIWNTQTVLNHANEVVIEADSIIYHSLSTARSGKKRSLRASLGYRVLYSTLQFCRPEEIRATEQ